MIDQQRQHRYHYGTSSSPPPPPPYQFTSPVKQTRATLTPPRHTTTTTASSVHSNATTQVVNSFYENSLQQVMSRSPVVNSNNNKNLKLSSPVRQLDVASLRQQRIMMRSSSPARQQFHHQQSSSPQVQQRSTSPLRQRIMQRSSSPPRRELQQSSAGHNTRSASPASATRQQHQSPSYNSNRNNMLSSEDCRDPPPTSDVEEERESLVTESSRAAVHLNARELIARRRKVRVEAEKAKKELSTVQDKLVTREKEATDEISRLRKELMVTKMKLKQVHAGSGVSSDSSFLGNEMKSVASDNSNESHSEKIAELNEELRMLKLSCEKTKDKARVEARKAQEDLKEARKNLGETEVASRNNIENLENELQLQVEETNRLRKALEILKEEEKQTIASATSASKQQIESLQSEVKRLQAKLKFSEASNSDVEMRIAEIMKNHKKELINQRNEHKGKLAEQTKKSALTMDKTLSVVLHKNDKLQARILELEELVAESLVREESLRMKLEDISITNKSEVESLQAEIEKNKSATDRAHEMTEEIKNLQLEKSSLESKIKLSEENYQRDIDKIKNELDAASKNLKKTEYLLECKEHEISDFVTKLDEMEETKSALEQTTKDLEEKLSAKEKLLEMKGKELNAMETQHASEIEKVENEVSVARKRLHDSFSAEKETVAALRKECDQLQQKLSLSRESKNQIKEDYEEEINKLKGELHAAKNDLHEAESDNARKLEIITKEKTEKLLLLQEEYADKSRSYDELIDKVSELEGEKLRAKETEKEYEFQIKVLKNEVKALKPKEVELTSMLSEVTELTARVDELKHQEKVLKEAHSLQKKELQEKILSLESNIRNRTISYGTLKNESKDLQDKLEEINNEKKEALNEALYKEDLLKTRIAELEMNATQPPIDINSKICDLENKVRMLTDEKTSLENDMFLKEKDHDAEIKSLKKKLVKFAEFQEKSDGLVDEIKTLREEKESLECQLSKKTEEYGLQVECLRQEIEKSGQKEQDENAFPCFFESPQGEQVASLEAEVKELKEKLANEAKERESLEFDLEKKVDEHLQDSELWMSQMEKVKQKMLEEMEQMKLKLDNSQNELLEAKKREETREEEMRKKIEEAKAQAKKDAEALLEVQAAALAEKVDILKEKAAYWGRLLKEEKLKAVEEGQRAAKALANTEAAALEAVNNANGFASPRSSSKKKSRSPPRPKIDRTPSAPIRTTSLGSFLAPSTPSSGASSNSGNRSPSSRSSFVFF